MADSNVAEFVAFTDSSEERARQYLTVCNDDLQQAIQLYFESDGADLGGGMGGAPAPAGASSGAANNPISIDDEDDDIPGRPSMEDDEAMARRLQQEMYGAQGSAEQDVRAPMARTTQTLLGPGSEMYADDDDVDAMVQEQIRRRQRPGKKGC